MAFFLIKVSGVPMLEGDISSRRPGYAEYIRRTNAFFPGWPKSVKPNEKGLQQ
jgi:steroid 5-alpha reductase family enzyme